MTLKQRICWCTPCNMVTGSSQLKIMRKLHRSLCQVHSKRLHNDTHVPCSLQSPHSKGIGMITYIWKMPLNRSIHDTRIVTPLIRLCCATMGRTIHVSFHDTLGSAVKPRVWNTSRVGGKDVITWTSVDIWFVRDCAGKFFPRKKSTIRPTRAFYVEWHQ